MPRSHAIVPRSEMSLAERTGIPMDHGIWPGGDREGGGSCLKPTGLISGGGGDLAGGDNGI